MRTLQYVIVRLRLASEWIQVSDAQNFPMHGKSQAPCCYPAAYLDVDAIASCLGQIAWDKLSQCPLLRKGKVRMLRRIQKPIAFSARGIAGAGLLVLLFEWWYYHKRTA